MTAPDAEVARRETQLLAQIGEQLMGPQWVSPLARELGVNLRTMQRWAAGDHRIDTKFWPILLDLINRRIAILNQSLLSVRALADAGALPKTGL